MDVASSFKVSVEVQTKASRSRDVQPGPIPPSPTGPYAVEIITNAEELSGIGQELQALDSLASCPMQSYRWVQACAESFTDEEQCIVVLRRKGEVAAYAALSRSANEKRLNCLGHQLFEPTVFSYADQSACQQLAIAILGLKRPVFLRDVYASFTIAQTVKSACHGRRICIERPMPAHPLLKLDETWLDPEQHLNSGRRSDLRRARRHAEKQGLLSFVIERLTPSTVEERMEEVFEVESRNWKGRNGSAMADTPAIQKFYRTYARMAAEQGIARVLMMRVGDTTVAVQFGVELNQRFWLLKMGYDEVFSRCSPGMLLMVESLRHATECGFEIFEMMGVREPWNHVWTESAHEAVSLRIYAPGIGGMIEAGTDVLRAGLRKAAERRARKK